MIRQTSSDTPYKQRHLAAPGCVFLPSDHLRKIWQTPGKVRQEISATWRVVKFKMPSTSTLATTKNQDFSHISDLLVSTNNSTSVDLVAYSRHSLFSLRVNRTSASAKPRNAKDLSQGSVSLWLTSARLEQGQLGSMQAARADAAHPQRLQA